MNAASNDGAKFDLLTRQVEAILFVSSQPISEGDLAAALGVTHKVAQEAVERIKRTYAAGHGLALIKTAGGWQMATAQDLEGVVGEFLSMAQSQRVRLSRAALETLSVVAYNQPVTRGEIEEIRAVRCDRVIDTLLKHGLIRIFGRKKGVGMPLLYRTTDRFLDIFGLESIASLPTLEDLQDYAIEPEGAGGSDDDA